MDGGIVPFAIAIKRSVDNGVSWSDADVIYEAWNKLLIMDAGNPLFFKYLLARFRYILQMKDLLCKVTSKNISMLKSLDSGISWSNEITEVSFRANHRDGMPVPMLLDDEIVVAIEDNLYFGQFKPYTVRTSVN